MDTLSQGIVEGEREERHSERRERERHRETERFPGNAIAIAWHFLKFPVSTLVPRVQY